MSAMPQFRDPRSAEPNRDPSPELKLRLPADLGAHAPNVEQAIRTTAFDDVLAVMSMGGLMIAGAFVFYVLFGMP